LISVWGNADPDITRREIRAPVAPGIFTKYHKIIGIMGSLLTLPVQQ
jgi:hypothetical protein